MDIPAALEFLEIVFLKDLLAFRCLEITAEQFLAGNAAIPGNEFFREFPYEFISQIICSIVFFFCLAMLTAYQHNRS